MRILSLALNQVLKIPWFLDMGNPKIIQGMGKSVTKKGKFDRVFLYIYCLSIVSIHLGVPLNITLQK